MDTSGFITLHHAVSSFIIKRGEDDRLFEKYMQFAIEAVSDINIGVLKSIRTIKLELEENNTASLPFDYVDYTVIGLEYDGRIHELTRNENIVIPTEIECGSYVRSTTSTSSNGNLTPRSGYIFSPFYYNGGYYTNYTATGGFNSAYFRIDEAERRIILLNDSYIADASLIMEYKTSGVSKNTIIPRDALSCIETFIDLQCVRFNRNYSMNDRLLAKKAYNNARAKLRARKYSFTAQEYKSVINSGLNQGVKR